MGNPNSFGYKVLGYAIVAASLFGIGTAVAANRRKERWYPLASRCPPLSLVSLYIYLPLTPEGVDSPMRLFGNSSYKSSPPKNFSCTNRGGDMKRQPIHPHDEVDHAETDATRSPARPPKAEKRTLDRPE